MSGIEGTEVDVLLLSAEEFAAYAASEEFDPRYSSGLGVSGGLAEDTVPAGEYAVVFDNTSRGEATPDGEAVSGRARVEVFAPD